MKIIKGLPAVAIAITSLAGGNITHAVDSTEQTNTQHTQHNQNVNTPQKTTDSKKEKTIAVENSDKIEVKTVVFKTNTKSNLVNEKKQTKLFEEKEITKDDAGLAKKVSTETSDTDKLIVKDQKSTSVALKKEAPKTTQKTTPKTTQETTTSTATKQTTQATPTQTPVQSGSVAQAGSKQQAIYQAALAQIGRIQDCTMLVTNSLKNVGINFHDWPIGYFSLGKQIPASEAVPGDLVYYANGGTGWAHIAVYAGNGQAVHGGWLGNQTVLNTVNTGSGPVYIRVA
jgi:lysM domain protein